MFASKTPLPASTPRPASPRDTSAQPPQDREISDFDALVGAEKPPAYPIQVRRPANEHGDPVIGNGLLAAAPPDGNDAPPSGAVPAIPGADDGTAALAQAQIPSPATNGAAPLPAPGAGWNGNGQPQYVGDLLPGTAGGDAGTTPPAGNPQLATVNGTATPAPAPTIGTQAPAQMAQLPGESAGVINPANSPIVAAATATQAGAPVEPALSTAPASRDGAVKPAMAKSMAAEPLAKSAAISAATSAQVAGATPATASQTQAQPAPIAATATGSDGTGSDGTAPAQTTQASLPGLSSANATNPAPATQPKAHAETQAGVQAKAASPGTATTNTAQQTAQPGAASPAAAPGQAAATPAPAEAPPAVLVEAATSTATASAGAAATTAAMATNASATPAGKFAQARQGVDERDGANPVARGKGKSSNAAAAQSGAKSGPASLATPGPANTSTTNTGAATPQPDTGTMPRDTAPAPAPIAQPAIALNAGGLTQSPATAGDATLTPLTASGLDTTRSGQSAAAERMAGQTPRFTPQAANQLAAQISQRFSNGSRVFGIRLDPAELGRVDIRLQMSQNNKVHATLTVERGDTLAELQRTSRELERSLNDAGLDLAEDGLSFELSQGSSDQHSAEPERGGNFNVYGQNDDGAQELAAQFDTGPGDAYGFALSRRDGVDVRV